MFANEFWITALVLVLIPGTGVLYTLSTALFTGKKNAVYAAIGCTLGIVPHLLASFLGLSAIMHMSAELFVWIKWIGVAYMLYLAYGMWKQGSSPQIKKSSSYNIGAKTLIRGILINILNPKLTLFFMAFMPVFIQTDSQAMSASTQLGLMSLVFMLMTLVVFVLYGLLAGVFRDYILKSQKIMSRTFKVFSGIFGFLGIKLAMED